MLMECPPSLPGGKAPDRERIQALLEGALGEDREFLTEPESKEVLAAYGVPIVETRTAADAREAAERARELGFPVALKLLSPDVTHKSDVGGVALGLASGDDVAAAFDRVVASAKEHVPDATIEGVAVQRMEKQGTEVIVGVTKDPQFGPVMMFGLGGVLVEVLKVVAFRVIPIEQRDAKQMIEEIKGYPLLEGYRGSDPADVSKLHELLLKLSAFIERHPEIAELDLNPVFAYKDGCIAVDARIVLDG